MPRSTAVSCTEFTRAPRPWKRNWVNARSPASGRLYGPSGLATSRCDILISFSGVLCVLANNCEEAMYKKLVTGLCAESSIPLIEVDSNKTLGEWSGLCKYDNNGQARKVVGCSCVVVKHFGDDTQELDTLLEILKKKNFA